MEDARALLRQQREARRVNHPHAAYSGAGKLLCVLCREHVRAEALWEAHTRSPAHRRKAASTPVGTNSPSGEDPEFFTPPLPPPPPPPPTTSMPAHTSEPLTTTGTKTKTTTTTAKRRFEDGGDDGDENEDEEAWRKRAKGLNGQAASQSIASPARRKSVTPSQGVELQIPSRMTPKSSASSAPPSSSVSMSVTPQPGVPMTLPLQASSGAALASASPSDPHTTITPPAPAPAPPQVDESEWAAFEADIAAASAPYDDDAVISRPAMTAEQSAAAAAAAEGDGDANPSTRRAKADADIEDEREEATRALEEEFDEMQELEARVRRLREKREALLLLRKDATPIATEGMADPVGSKNMDLAEGRGNGARPGGRESTSQVDEDNDNDNNDDGEDDDDDDDDDDDWDGFRFRTGR